MAASVEENLLKVNERILQACRKSGRDPSEVKLMAACKSVPIKHIKEAIDSGIRLFGENYVQEATEKIKKIKLSSVKWHFIGHLQKNKAAQAVGLFDMIHSVDKLGLAKELNKRTKEPLKILMQINIGDERTKGGVTIQEAPELAREIGKLKNIVLKGLMAIPPYNEDPEKTRPYFTTIRRVAERINKERIPGVVLTELSMGMSHDFEIAIEEGATFIRIGTALFGERKETKGK
ncbi:MAG: YggS family pyridoxal phosphate-dependent enzyme [Thermodesulfobacteriota bacterium]